MARTRKQGVPPEAMRARIVDTAEGLFRQVGYSKTTVADIAAALGMSPANVYRFFASKAAINESICERLLRRVEDRARQALDVDGEGGAPRKLCRFLLEYHRAMRSNTLADKRLHDMVIAAVAEHWSVVTGHIQRIHALLRHVLEQGIIAGEFRAMAPAATARALQHAVAAFVYPELVEKALAETLTTGGEDTIEEELRHLLGLLLEGLLPGRAGPTCCFPGEQDQG